MHRCEVDEITRRDQRLAQCLKRLGQPAKGVTRPRGLPQHREPQTNKRRLVAHQHHRRAAGCSKDLCHPNREGAPTNQHQRLVASHSTRSATRQDCAGDRPQRRTFSFWPG